MYFYLPTKIYSERDCVKQHADEWTSLGRKALIVTGRSSAKNGSLEDVTSSLEERNISYCIYSDIEENPSIETVMKTREFGLKEQVDFVIGIGGGSPMDAAKAVALMIEQKEQGADYLYQKGSDAALPVVEVPTTCGTGSEATSNAVLTIHEKRTKSSLPHRIFPRFALVDGKYLQKAPRSLLVNTSVDALSHFIESYVNANATEYSRMLCTYGMGIWSSCKNILIGAAAGDADYDRLMCASTIAGMSISHTGTALPHALSYYLTYEKGIPHGKAAGYFLPGYLAQANPVERRKVLELIGFPDMQYFQSFIQRLIGTMEAEDELVDRAVHGTMAKPEKLKNVPYKVTEDVLYRICSAAAGKTPGR